LIQKACVAIKVLFTQAFLKRDRTSVRSFMSNVAATLTFSGLLQKKQHRAPEKPVRAAPVYLRQFRSAVAMDDSIPLETRITSGKPSLQGRVVSLYEAHREGIYRFLVGHGMTSGEAQEAAQDVFVDLFRALQKGTSIGSEQAWLYTVAGRAAVDYWRRNRFAGSTQVDLDSAAADLRSVEPSPEAQAAYLERLRRVAAAVARLSKEQRMCIQLRMQGLRYREIGRILGVSTSTAAEWLVAAVGSLRRDSQ
jgi:RNA polymerase sigma-70 factor, ECF subfamily